ncbi:pyridoxal phosphate-dependent decarboxylase family protein [Desertimonas flava]|uniref:pyridoxal phosphate-dependent decarboxylase family protein n=1 Tax=Desertimonas flava TaxID=2064846 RepID=UPI000E357E9E|nr:aminotransferase class V-fold PLP-dependent enzyme [Desertimonas flava]
MPLPRSGRPADDVLAELDQLGGDDVDWAAGRCFSLVYSAGPDVERVADEAARRFAMANALNTDAFPSLRRMQSDVVGVVSDWLGAPDGSAGFMTSGGTESLLMAVKAARERHRRLERGSGARPNVVLPTSAHAAFEKGCHYFGLESRRVEVGADWRADPDAIAAAVDVDTALIVASAPQYPQGVIDPVAAIAAIAAEGDINCHVDACIGGVTLAYLPRLGEEVAPWAFEVDGVTSVSVDLHKFAYTAKGASVIVHRDKQRRSDQTFLTDNWLGGRYGSPAVLGTRSGGPIAAAWAVLNHIGDDGYLELTRRARAATLELAAVIDAEPRVVLLARPDGCLLSFAAADPDQLDVFAVADALRTRGWFVDRQGPPRSLHCTVNAIHDGTIAEFATALADSVDEAGGRSGASGAYATIS